MTSPSTRPFTLDDSDALDAEIAGRKAATLARLRAAGEPVPDGVVVPAGADALGAARVVCDLFEQGTRLAVRSSSPTEDLAGRSYAGQYLTVLDVVGHEALGEAIARVRASVGDPAARGYEHEWAASPPMAVLVMPLINADVAGVAFTADPVTGEECVVIEAARGVGVSVVDGSVTPERWRCRTGGSPEIDSGDASVLGAELAAAVAALARRVAALQGSPQDIEWTVADGVVHLLQTRPITTLPPAARDGRATRGSGGRPG